MLDRVYLASAPGVIGLAQALRNKGIDVVIGHDGTFISDPEARKFADRFVDDFWDRMTTPLSLCADDFLAKVKKDRSYSRMLTGQWAEVSRRHDAEAFASFYAPQPRRTVHLAAQVLAREKRRRFIQQLALH